MSHLLANHCCRYASKFPTTVPQAGPYVQSYGFPAVGDGARYSPFASDAESLSFPFQFPGEAQTQDKICVMKRESNGVNAKPVGSSEYGEANKPAMTIPDSELPWGYTSDQVHQHEHGHILAYTAEGLDPLRYISHEHMDAILQNAPGAVQVAAAGVKPGLDGIKQRITGLMGGAAANEVHDKIPRFGADGSALGIARDDFAQTRDILAEQGIEGEEAEILIDEAYQRARQHVSNVEAVAVMKANIGLREENLPSTLHISDERMKNYVEILNRSLR